MLTLLLNIHCFLSGWIWIYIYISYLSEGESESGVPFERREAGKGERRDVAGEKAERMREEEGGREVRSGKDQVRQGKASKGKLS